MTIKIATDSVLTLRTDFYVIETPKWGLWSFVYLLPHGTCPQYHFQLYYCPQDDGTVRFKQIAEMSDNMLFEYPSASFHTCGDFNIHQKEWWVYLNKTDEEDRYCWNFSVAYELTQIIEELIVTSCPEKRFAEVLTPLHTSDHSLVNVNPKSSPRVLFNRMVFSVCESQLQ